MFTTNRIELVGDPDRICDLIYSMAAKIEEWPRILPHYRYLRIVERAGNSTVADFGATRDGIPVRWRAVQELFPEERRITFRHIRGVTRGMWVEWRIEPTEGGALVTIDHELTYSLPVLGPIFARYVVGDLFVHNIASKTLRRMKSLAEAKN